MINPMADRLSGSRPSISPSPTVRSSFRSVGQPGLRIVIAVIAAALALTSCGGGDDPELTDSSLPATSDPAAIDDPAATSNTGSGTPTEVVPPPTLEAAAQPTIAPTNAGAPLIDVINQTSPNASGFIAEDGTVFAATADGYGRAWSVTETRPAAIALGSHNGKLTFATSDGNVYLHTPSDEKTVQRIYTSNDTRPAALSLGSHNGDLAIATGDGTVFVADGPSDAPTFTRIFAPTENRSGAIELSTRGALAIRDTDGNVFSYDAAAEPKISIAYRTTANRSPAIKFGYHAEMLVLANEAGELFMRDGAEIAQVYRPNDNRGPAIELGSHQGRIALSTNTGEIYIGTETNPPRFSRAHRPNVNRPAAVELTESGNLGFLTIDGRIYAFADDPSAVAARVWFSTENRPSAGTIGTNNAEGAIVFTDATGRVWTHTPGADSLIRSTYSPNDDRSPARRLSNG